MSDYISLDSDIESNAKISVSNIKLIAALFIIFIIISSDFFAMYVLSNFGPNAIIGSAPTACGVIIQGIFLILFYLLAIYLTENNII